MTKKSGKRIDPNQFQRTVRSMLGSDAGSEIDNRDRAGLITALFEEVYNFLNDMAEVVDEISEELSDIKGSSQKTSRAVTGDTQYGVIGIAERIGIQELDIKTLSANVSKVNSEMTKLMSRVSSVQQSLVVLIAVQILVIISLLVAGVIFS